MASLKLVNKTWQIRFKDPATGKWTTKTTGCKHKVNAMAKFVEFDRKLEAGTLVVNPVKPKSINQHLSDWEKVLNARGNGHEYIDTTIRRVGKLLEEVGDLTKLTESTLILRMSKLGVGDRSKKHYRMGIKMFTRWMFVDGRLAADPLATMKTATKVRESDRVRRVLSETDFQKLLDASPFNHAVVYLLAANSGLRANEIRRLPRNHLRLIAGEASVCVRASLSKNGKREWLPLPDDVAVVIDSWMLEEERGDTPFSWLPNGTAKMLRWDLKRAGIPYQNEEGYFDFHALRNTYITRLALTNAPLAVVQRLARHSTPVLTLNTYAKIQTDDKVRAVQGLPKVLPLRHMAK